MPIRLLTIRITILNADHIGVAPVAGNRMNTPGHIAGTV
jgi:hypothetical protein